MGLRTGLGAKPQQSGLRGRRKATEQALASPPGPPRRDLPRVTGRGRPQPVPNDRPTGRLAVWLVAAAVAASAAGVALAAGVLTATGTEVEPTSTIVAIAAGRLEVGPLMVKAQPRAEDMIGMPPEQHAAHETVTALVPVTLVNTSNASLSYSADEFRLLTSDEELAPVSEQPDRTVQTLRPGAAITMRLSFTAASVDRARLRYTPAAGSPVEATLATAPAGAVTQGGGTHEEDRTHDDGTHDEDSTQDDSTGGVTAVQDESQPHEHAADTAKDH